VLQLAKIFCKSVCETAADVLHVLAILVSISPIFYKQLFYTKVLCAAFTCLQFGFVIFWQKDFGARAAHKMLVKLTLGRRIKVGLILFVSLFIAQGSQAKASHWQFLWHILSTFCQCKWAFKSLRNISLLYIFWFITLPKKVLKGRRNKGARELT